MKHKAMEGISSTIRLALDGKRDKAIVVGLMVYLDTGELSFKFDIREERIRELTDVEAQIESLMGAAYLCRMRLEKLKTEISSRKDLDGFIATRSGTVLFDDFKPFKVFCAPEIVLDHLFKSAV